MEGHDSAESLAKPNIYTEVTYVRTPSVTPQGMCVSGKHYKKSLVSVSPLIINYEMNNLVIQCVTTMMHYLTKGSPLEPLVMVDCVELKMKTHHYTLQYGNSS
ncbi:hypothetical protein STEG23_000602, partial [Scotinomys teguina]